MIQPSVHRAVVAAPRPQQRPGHAEVPEEIGAGVGMSDRIGAQRHQVIVRVDHLRPL